MPTPKQLANLIPNKPGEIRNPKGRGKGVLGSKTRLLRLLELVQNVTNPITGEVEGFSILEQIDMKLILKAKKGDLSSIRELLDRLEGRPGQSVDVTSAGEKIQSSIMEVIDGVYGTDPKDDTEGK